MNKIQARDIMSQPAIAVGPEATVPELVHEMSRHGISGLPVTEGGRLVGIVTESDILAKEVGLGGLPELDYGAPVKRARALSRREAYRARSLMTRNVVTAGETSSVRDIARTMVRHGFNHIPIVKDERLVGIVTRSDVIGVFERSPRAVLADVRRALREDLRVDPDGLDVVVRDGVVTLSGQLEHAADVGLVSTLLPEIDGVAAVDISGLTSSRSAWA